MPRARSRIQNPISRSAAGSRGTRPPGGRHRFLVLAALALVGGLTGWSPAEAQAPPSGADRPDPVVTGRVVDEAGEPVAGAMVVVQGPVEGSQVTGAAGAFRFEVPAGEYQVRAEAFGYRSASEAVAAGTGQAPVRLVLEASPLGLEGVRVVTTTRGGKNPATLPVKINVLEDEELEQQLALATNPTELIANLVPSFSPARQKLTSSGESFRGRRPLFLIDGVPQSNPLRDGRRDGFTIGMESVERVEVVFGANAIQGLGATGGIVNYITVTPSRTGELEQKVVLSGTGSGGLDGDGYGWSGHYLATKRIGDVDVLGSVTYERRGLQYDGEGRPIGLDNVQGDISDSESRSFFGKVGWDLTADQRVQASVSDFRLAQDGDFELVAGDREAGVPAVAVEGDPAGVEPINDVTTASLDYEHRALAGGRLSAKAYYQDFSALYGGGVYGIFQDPELGPVGELFDQSENNSEKFGTRLTYARDRALGLPVGVVAGLDFLRDRTFQRLAQTDRNWVPETTFYNYAPFVQLDVDVLDALTVSGGLRYELAQLDVPDFTTIAGNRADFRSVRVEGGEPSFDEPLVNVGAVLTPVPGLRVYGTFSQAFTMPDVGRVLRGVSEEGTEVESYLTLEPIETDNVEVGTSWGTSISHVGITWFRSESDHGSRLVPNADGIFQVFRQPTRTRGWEFTGRLDPTRRLSLAAGYSLLEGSFDGDGDGDMESDLGAADIGPDRLNVSLDVNRGGRFSGRLQAFRFFDRTFHDGDGQVAAEFDGYTTADASVAARFGRARVSLSAANLFDTQYITYYGQAATSRDDRYFAGRGRTFTVRVETRF